jgi:flagellar hook-associated protein 3 FlgL
MRVPTLHTSRQALDIITTRQAEQARLQTGIASGLRVRSPGEDPAAAAQAELARSRLAHIAQDQRAAQLATSVLNTADGALSAGTDLLQAAREAVVAAGNGSYNALDRKALAAQLRGTREQLLVLANTSDGAGAYVFGGQGAQAGPVSGAASPAYDPAAGRQQVGEAGRYDASVDGRAVFMALPQGNGVFVTGSAAANTGTGWIGAGSVTDASQLTGHGYSISVGGTAAAPTYSVSDTTLGTTLASNVAFTSGGTIDIDGQRVRLSGTPAAGDSFALAPAGQQSVFRTLDDAIALLEGTPGTAAYNEGMERAHTGLDRALDAVGIARTSVGEALRGLDTSTAANDQEQLAVTTRRSSLRDIDLAQAISELQGSQVSTDAALKTYAAMSRKSLFDMIP